LVVGCRIDRRHDEEPGLMSVDVEQQAWVGTFAGCAPAAFDIAFRHAQERVVGHLLGPLALPVDQALGLTRRTMADTLETIAQNRSADEPLDRLAGTARILLRKLVRAEIGNAAGLDVDFEPEPDGSMLGAFYDGVPGVDEALARRFGLPPFLDLIHLAVLSLPAAERAAVGAADEASAMLCGVAGALLISAVEPAGGCMVLRQHLDRADWRPGMPYDPVLRARALHHVASCPSCTPRHEQAVARIESLPAVLLPTVLGLSDHRADYVETLRAEQPDEPPTGPIGAPISSLLAPPGDATAAVPASPLPPEPRPERSRRRPVALIALGAVAALALGLGVLLTGGSDDQQASGADPTGAVNAVGTDPDSSPADPSASAPTAPATTPASSPPSAPSTPPSSPAAGQSPTGATGPASNPASRPAVPPSASAPASRPGSSAPAPPPASSAPPAVGHLTISIGALSTGHLDVTVAGASAGSCNSQCTFPFHVGDTIQIDPVDVVNSWPAPCAGTSTSATCTFTASSDVSIRVSVFRSL
jgi:hypothetical protein